MTIRFIFDGKDPECLKVAKRLVAETNVVVEHVEGASPKVHWNGVWLQGREHAEQLLALDALYKILKARAEAEGGPMFMGWPDRWYETYKRRCTNDHVGTMVLKSEGLGRDACLKCNAPVVLTFPEDSDGSLEEESNAQKTS